MQTQTVDSIRTRVDSIRDAALSQEDLLRSISDDPEGFVKAQGLLKGDPEHDAARAGHGPIHACPWQTCQATRIMPDS